MIRRRAPLKRTPIKRKLPSFAALERVDWKSVMDELGRKPIPKKRTKARRGPMRDPKYRRWLVENGVCAACKAANLIYRDRQCATGWTIDPAHTENNGMSSKGPDSSCAPLCRPHHQEFDAGRAAFEAKYNVDMKIEAARWFQVFSSQTKNI